MSREDISLTIDVPYETVPDSIQVEQSAESLFYEFLSQAYYDDQNVSIQYNNSTIWDDAIGSLRTEQITPTLEDDDVYRIQQALLNTQEFVGNVTVTDYAGKIEYESSNGIILENPLGISRSKFSKIEEEAEELEISEQEERINSRFLDEVVNKSVSTVLPVLASTGALEELDGSNTLMSKEYRWTVNQDRSVDWRDNNGRKITAKNLTPRDMAVAQAFNRKARELYPHLMDPQTPRRRPQSHSVSENNQRQSQSRPRRSSSPRMSI